MSDELRGKTGRPRRGTSPGTSGRGDGVGMRPGVPGAWSTTGPTSKGPGSAGQCRDRGRRRVPPGCRMPPPAGGAGYHSPRTSPASPQLLATLPRPLLAFCARAPARPGLFMAAAPAIGAGLTVASAAGSRALDAREGQWLWIDSKFSTSTL